MFIPPNEPVKVISGMLVSGDSSTGAFCPATEPLKEIVSVVPVNVGAPTVIPV